MERATDIAEIVVVLLAPVGLIYSWHFYLTKLTSASGGWRNGVTLLCLALVSLVALPWPVMFMLMPQAGWGSGRGVGHQVAWIESWHRPINRKSTRLNSSHIT